MKELTNLLKNVSNSYDSFVSSVLTYAGKKKSRLEVVKKFVIEHPTANTSDILEFISNLDDFYEDAIYAEAQSHSA